MCEAARAQTSRLSASLVTQDLFHMSSPKLNGPNIEQICGAVEHNALGKSEYDEEEMPHLSCY
jgi:hypothetical protein